VSFHIGSGATDANSFTDAIAAARKVFKVAEQLQLPAMNILDIGGGFTAGCNGTLSFLDAAAAVNAALDEYFPPSMEVTIIAEPGRYFAESPSTLATTIIGKRVRGNLKEYWINDGIYGSMNCLLYDHAELKYRPLPHASLSTSTYANGSGNICTTVHNSTVFGPTCDGLDTVLRSALLPDLAVGDWLIFPNMGAYTAAAGSSFNGFATSDIPTFYVFSDAFNNPCSIAHRLLKSLLAEDDVVIDNINNHNHVGSGRQIMCTANDGFS
jgi:ornithine decarboxylase